MEETLPTPEEQPLPAPPSSFQKIFVGPDGIRAGWGIAIFLLVFAACALILNLVLRYLLHHTPPPKGTPPTIHTMLIGELAAVIFTAIATFVMSRIEKRKFTAYGLGGARRAPMFIIGLFWGFVFISLLVGGLHLTHNITFEPSHEALHAALRYGAAWGACFLLVGFFEEMFTRGYMLWALWRGVGFWWGALILAVAFALMHGKNPGESPVGLFSAGAVGLVLCLSIWYTRSLWWAIGFHAAWDWGQTFFYGASDSGLPTKGSFFIAHPQGNLWMSGGLTGPEGSLLVLPILLLIVLVIYATQHSTPVAD
jgi:membrane protease YdiL (CAAX protease family)